MPDLVLRPLTQEEYVVYRQMAIPELARAQADAFALTWDEAERRACSAFDRLIPSGILDGSGQHIVSIDAGSSQMGILWYELRNDGSDAYLYDLYIYESYRRQGFARGALDLLSMALSDMGVKRIMLSVFAWNAPAQALYLASGYQERSVLMMKTIER